MILGRTGTGGNFRSFREFYFPVGFAVYLLMRMFYQDKILLSVRSIDSTKRSWTEIAFLIGKGEKT